MKSQVFLLFLILSILFGALQGCADTANVTGEYVAELGGEQGQKIGLQLEPGGQGCWTTEDDRISFEWESHAGEIRLHSKTGGVIEGRLLHDDIEFTVPGAGRVTFKKAIRNEELGMKNAK
jgi:hypothetical protein